MNVRARQARGHDGEEQRTPSQTKSIDFEAAGPFHSIRQLTV